MDARRRIADPVLSAAPRPPRFIFPYVGTIVYMIVRPPEYLEDVRERELEIAAAEARLAQVEQLVCPYCDFEIEKSFLRCPSCLRRLKEPCQSCGRPLDPRWKICPYCEAEVGQAQPAAAPSRPSRARGGAERRETSAHSLNLSRRPPRARRLSRLRSRRPPCRPLSSSSPRSAGPRYPRRLRRRPGPPSSRPSRALARRRADRPGPRAEPARPPAAKRSARRAPVEPRPRGPCSISVFAERNPTWTGP